MKKNILSNKLKPQNPLSDCIMCYDIERENKVVAKLKEQIKDANKIILDIICMEPNLQVGIYEYIKKWKVRG